MKPMRALLLLGFLTLTACTQTPPPPSVQPVLARLTRATLTLHIPQNLNRWGDVIIPTRALTRVGGYPGVFVLSAHNRSRFRLVKIGKIKGPWTEILSGLNGTETLVLPPFRHVYDGSPIQPHP